MHDTKQDKLSFMQGTKQDKLSFMRGTKQDKLTNLLVIYIVTSSHLNNLHVFGPLSHIYNKLNYVHSNYNDFTSYKKIETYMSIAK